jgi:hypothetical protein
LSLAAKLRQLAVTLERETSGLSGRRTNELLDLANQIDTQETNLIYLSSCIAATADDLAERKSTPTYQINRQYEVVDATLLALTGFAAWKFAPTKADTIARIERVKPLLAARVKRIEQ